MRTYQSYSTRRTPQSEAIPGSTQVENNAGGFAWEIDDWARLDRFLILGTEGGTYYVGEQELTKRNAEVVLRCIKADGERAVRRIAEVSEAGRAPKNDPAIFALAMAASEGNTETRRAALQALPTVCRIGTHLFHFAAFVEQFRGWGRGLRAAVRRWYDDKELGALAYQLVKYQQRDGWSHRDMLRLAHPKATGDRNHLYNWIVKRSVVEELPAIVRALEKAYQVDTPSEIVTLISEHQLPRECIPTQFLNDKGVWTALLETMPMTAMIRNLATMTRVGLIGPMAPANATVIERLQDGERLRKARVHPIAVLAALKTYESGHGARGQHTWEPVPQITDALDTAFYMAFENVEPTRKRILLSLDVSGSMDGGTVAGVPGLTPRVASSAMAMVTARSEPTHAFMAFHDDIQPLSISPRERLDAIVAKTHALPFGGTDCALPMLYAMKRQLAVDSFLVYTDSETWFGTIHPAQALVEYRRQTGIPAKLVVVGMVANRYTIADPNDPGMMDIVGFDTATPNVISDFVSA